MSRSEEFGGQFMISSTRIVAEQSDKVKICHGARVSAESLRHSLQDIIRRVI